MWQHRKGLGDVWKSLKPRAKLRSHVCSSVEVMSPDISKACPSWMSLEKIIKSNPIWAIRRTGKTRNLWGPGEHFCKGRNQFVTTFKRETSGNVYAHTRPYLYFPEPAWPVVGGLTITYFFLLCCPKSWERNCWNQLSGTSWLFSLRLSQRSEGRCPLGACAHSCPWSKPGWKGPITAEVMEGSPHITVTNPMHRQNTSVFLQLMLK